MYEHCQHCMLKYMTTQNMKSEDAYKKLAPKPSYTEIRLNDYQGNTVILYKCNKCETVKGL